MVLSSGSKSARHAQSICNRTNVCGGPKKAGLVSRVGVFLSNNPNLIGAMQTMPKTCVVSSTIQTQLYGYRATIGGV